MESTFCNDLSSGNTPFIKVTGSKFCDPNASVDPTDDFLACPPVVMSTYRANRPAECGAAWEMKCVFVSFFCLLRLHKAKIEIENTVTATIPIPISLGPARNTLFLFVLRLDSTLTCSRSA
jgi:hypothetical protein